MKKTYKKIVKLLFVTIFGLFVYSSAFCDAEPPLSISGRISRSAVAGMSFDDVSISVLGTTELNIKPDRFGNYIVRNLPRGGTYTIKLSKKGYSFSPASRTYRGLTESKINENYIPSVKTYSIGGRVLAGGKPVKGVTLMINNRNVKYFTDQDGVYTIDNLEYEGPYTVSVISNNYNYEPFTVDYLEKDIVHDFTKDIILSGQVTSFDKPVKNIEIDINGVKYKTDENGMYIVKGLVANIDCKIMLSNEALLSNPAYISLLKISNDKENLNFEVSAKIYGSVTYNNKPLPNTVVRIKENDRTCKTNDKGEYEFSDLSLNDEYTVEVLAGTKYSVEPKEWKIKNLAKEKNTKNFVVGIKKYKVNIIAKSGANAISNATVNVLETKGVFKTNAQGECSIDGLKYGATYTFSIKKQGVNFVESKKQIVNNDIENMDIVFQTPLTISGFVKNDSKPLANAIVQCGNQKVKTDAKGKYTLKSLKPGESYTISVSSNNFVFDEPTKTIEDLDESKSNVNFIIDTKSKKKIAIKAEEERLAKEAEEARIKAEQEEQARLAKEAEEKAKEEAKIKAEQEKLIKEAETVKLEAEKETKLMLVMKTETKTKEESKIKAEEERLAKEAEKARIKAEKEEQTRLAKEAELKAKEEAKIKAEEERLAKEAEKARIKAEKEEQAKLAKEAELKAKEEAKIKAEEERLAKEAEKARIKAEKEEQAKLAKEAEEQARIKAEEERIAREVELERQAKEAKAIQIKVEKEEQERIAKEAERKAEEEKLAKEAEEARLKAEKEEQERIAKEAEMKAQEEEKMAKTIELRAEEARLAKEASEESKRIEEERLAKKLEEAKIQAEKEEQERIAKEAEMKAQEEERLAKEIELKAQKEAERKVEEEKLAKEAEEARLKAEKEEQERIAKEAEMKAQEEERLAKEMELKAQKEAEMKAEEEAKLAKEMELKAEEARLAKEAEEARIKAEKERKVYIKGRILKGRDGIANTQIRVLTEDEEKIYLTDKNGFYKITNLLKGENYTITVVSGKADLSLSPKVRMYKKIDKNLENQNFYVIEEYENVAVVSNNKNADKNINKNSNINTNTNSNRSVNVNSNNNIRKEERVSEDQENSSNEWYSEYGMQKKGGLIQKQIEW